MEDINEKTLELLKQKFPEYQKNKEDFRKNHSETYALIEFYETEVEEKRNQEYIKKNWVRNYHLKKHFSLLTEEETQRQKEVDSLTAKSFRLDYDLYVDMREKSTIYYEDVKVLLTYNYPYYSAYKIGNSIEDSEFIECSIYTNDIYKIIDIFLKTGEKVHDV